MSLNQEQKKHFKSLGHHLKPVVTVAEQGLSDNLMAELDRALNDHELIKIQLRLSEREDRQAMLTELCQQSSATLVQSIGKMALIYRKNPRANPKLSNVLRHQ